MLDVLVMEEHKLKCQSDIISQSVPGYVTSGLPDASLWPESGWQLLWYHEDPFRCLLVAGPTKSGTRARGPRKERCMNGLEMSENKAETRATSTRYLRFVLQTIHHHHRPQEQPLKRRIRSQNHISCARISQKYGSVHRMALFPPNRSLLYPQFETYRLHPLDPTDDVHSYPLPGSGATQSRLEYGQHNLSFKEVRARIGWDHLAIDKEGRGVYVDKDWNVVGFILDVSPS